MDNTAENESSRLYNQLNESGEAPNQLFIAGEITLDDFDAHSSLCAKNDSLINFRDIALNTQLAVLHPRLSKFAQMKFSNVVGRDPEEILHEVLLRRGHRRKLRSLPFAKWETYLKIAMNFMFLDLSKADSRKISIDGNMGEPQTTSGTRTNDFSNQVDVMDAISTLEEFEQELVFDRYFRGMTLNEVGKKHKMRTQRTFRLLESALLKLKTTFAFD